MQHEPCDTVATKPNPVATEQNPVATRNRQTHGSGTAQWAAHALSGAAQGAQLGVHCLPAWQATRTATCDHSGTPQCSSHSRAQQTRQGCTDADAPRTGGKSRTSRSRPRSACACKATEGTLRCAAPLFLAPLALSLSHLGPPPLRPSPTYLPVSPSPVHRPLCSAVRAVPRDACRIAAQSIQVSLLSVGRLLH